MLVTHQLKMMGTLIDIQIDSGRADQQLTTVCQLFETYKNRFSANDADSELMAINDHAGQKAIVVHPQLFELIQIGKEHSLADTSNLNIAIGPLVQSWRIGFSDAHLPSDATIKKQLALTNPENIILNHEKSSVFLTEPGMKIDLGALAKGYIADLIMDYLVQDGIKSAMINLGGNVLVYGDNSKRPDGLFYIGIQHPEKKRGHNLGLVKIKNQSVVTSGIYERRLKIADKEYHHIFDKETGYPIETDMASLTIIADASLDCEIWTTRLFGLDSLRVFHILNQLPTIEGIIVTKDNRIAVSNGLKDKWTLLYN
ncbi:FAD:protein FMN transferase [Streptococcus uberis]|uniref:FAD:protein FMN transferase n=1 Tax=Streptococcus uberis TaxID=1349 RepID=UPI001FF1F7DA|nr:FAD:protein FMN transferase [Streptococcus uberis]MCK1160970.1 FAD:protein FMN transferase [Streptococcus uberis]MCK1164738.1 FAD:protein FMN transferase [Streptococcus uberis]MCK1203454.1 FAD:protein FMN transferase [Streptococcus uberis]MCK1231054.1 FAD:protein FMN transferase [Streptococcus uberis]MCK1232914.1 FAD:protein FMN transferase [Streptococcus uberis]